MQELAIFDRREDRREEERLGAGYKDCFQVSEGCPTAKDRSSQVSSDAQWLPIA